MATKIVTKNSSTASAVPTASDLVQGELAVNVADKRLFTEDNAGAIVELGTNPSTIDINAGTIDGTTVGASSASTGAFTTLTATGAFTSRGIDDNADATAITIDSSENVGIGVAPAFPFHVQASDGTLAQFSNGVDADCTIRTASGVTLITPSTGTLALGTSSTERMRISSSGSVGINTSSPAATLHTVANSGTTGFLLTGAASNNIASFYTSGGSQAMTLDSSGNLLVGKTSTAVTTGCDMRPTGNIVASASADNPLYLNRSTNDGDIAVFAKDGTAVGSIGTLSGTMYIGNGDCNLLFTGASDAMLPVGTNGATKDGQLDLGSSGNRFNNFYLSGGIYIGGTGGANRFDDYEEGTWTPVTGPTSTTATYLYRSGYYTKVGNLVTCTFGLKHNGGVWTGDEANISGLPFAPDTTGAYQEPQFIVTALGLAPTGQGGSSSGGAFNIGEVSFYLGGGETFGRGRSYVSNADTVMGANAVFATNSFIKATIIYYSS